jgi:hypothetical protein
MGRMGNPVPFGPFGLSLEGRPKINKVLFA